MIDVDLLITNQAPDTEEEIISGEPLCGDGKMTPTFQKAQEIAVKYKGHWADWEPYRCTYEFPSNDLARKFAKDIHQNLGKSVTFDKEQLEKIFAHKHKK